MNRNDVMVEFDVSSTEITTSGITDIPAGNQNHILAKFNFWNNWDGMNKSALFVRGGAQFLEPLEDDMCHIPDFLMQSEGPIGVSVVAGDLRTTNSTTINVTESDYSAFNHPSTVYVQTPEGSIPKIKYDGAFMFYAEDRWQTLDSSGVDVDIIKEQSITWVEVVDNEMVFKTINGTERQRVTIPVGGEDISTPNVIWLNVNAVNSEQNGTFANPYINMQDAWDAAQFGDLIIGFTGVQQGDVHLSNKQNITMWLFATTGQYRTIVEGNFTIDRDCARLGFNNIQINGDFTSDGSLIYPDNFAVRGHMQLGRTAMSTAELLEAYPWAKDEKICPPRLIAPSGRIVSTEEQLGGYTRIDQGFYNTVEMGGGIVAEMIDCRSETDGRWKVTDNATGLITNYENMMLEHEGNSVAVVRSGADSGWLPVGDNVAIRSTSDTGLLWIDGANLMLGDGTYASIQKTGNCPCVFGLNQYNPANSVLNGPVYKTAVQGDQVEIGGIRLPEILSDINGKIGNGSNFVLKLSKTGLNIVINNSMNYNILSALSLTDAVNIFGRDITDYSMSGGVLKTPKPKGDPMIAYDISVRLSGTIAGGTSATTAREVSIRLRRADDTTLEALPLIKVGPNPLENRAVVFNTFSIGEDDPYIVDGLKIVVANNSDQQMTITGIEIVIIGSDS